MTRHSAICLAGMILIAACTQVPTNGSARPGDDTKFVLTGDQKADWDQILAIEERAKALVRPDGCASDDQCRSAAVGSRACGGPRYYLVYCARTTDTVALSKKLEEVAAAERAYNVRYHIASTCEFRMPPSVGLVGGACAAR